MAPTHPDCDLCKTPRRRATAPGQPGAGEQPGQRATVWTVTTFDPDHSFVWHAKVMGVKTVATHVVNPTPTGCRNSLILEMTGRGSRVFGGLLGRKLRKVLRTENEGSRSRGESA